MAYNMPVRFIAAFNAKRFRMPPELAALYTMAARRIIDIFKKPERDLCDQYVLSHALNLYARGQLNAVRAVDAPVNSYMGLPEGFDEFAAASVAPAAAIVRAAAPTSGFQADVPVETASLLYGEMDLVTTDGDCVVEIKCSAETTAAGLRGSSSCVNLLQVLAYVAIGRHGAPPRRNPKWAILVNPLTATWERYDMTTWSMEQSATFCECLEELRRRG
jgi:hypothetical protein